MRIGFGVAFIGILWVLLEGLLAYFDGMLTPRQMSARHPSHTHGVPFICHGGMWGDIFIISPIAGTIIAFYGDQWSAKQMLAMGGTGIALSIVLHRLYVTTPFPDSLAWKGGISPAGWMHVFYMALAFAVICLLYFCTANVPFTFLAMVSMLLTAQVAVSTHLVLGLLNESYRWPWCPDLIRKPDPWIALTGTCIALVGITQWATRHHS